MPIYLDRHDLYGSLAEAVSDAHQKDLKLQEDNRLFGSAVLLASRLCDDAEPNRILVAPVVKELCMGKGFTFLDRGETVFKGFDQPQRVFEVDWQKG